MKHLGRRSKQAQMKVEKMKNAYMTPKEPKASKATTVSLTCTEFIILDKLPVSNSPCIIRFS
jgi:hypothetical protein